MILIYDISDRDKNPFLVTWVNRAGDPLGRDPSQPPLRLCMIESRTVAERDNNYINVRPLLQIFGPSNGSGSMFRWLI